MRCPDAPRTGRIILRRRTFDLLGFTGPQTTRFSRRPIHSSLVVISQAHKTADLPSPTTSSLVRRTHAGIRRSIGTAQAAKAPAVVSDLKRMLAELPSTHVGLRDRAPLLLGFAGAFRRSELVALDVADLEFSSAGLAINLRGAKTDQEAAGRRIGVPYGSNEKTCPVRSLQAWLESARITQGAVFRSLEKFQRVQPRRLSDKAVARIVKRRAKDVGLDPDRYAGHSLRAGLATLPKRVQTAEGEISVDMPQVRGTAAQFISRVFPDSRTVIRTRPLEALIIGGYVRGLSDRDIESLM